MSKEARRSSAPLVGQVQYRQLTLFEGGLTLPDYQGTLPGITVIWPESKPQPKLRVYERFNIRRVALAAGVVLSLFTVPSDSHQTKTSPASIPAPVEQSLVTTPPFLTDSPLAVPAVTPQPTDTESQAVHIFAASEQPPASAASAAAENGPSSVTPRQSVEITGLDPDKYTIPPVNKSVWLEAVNAAREVEEHTGIPASDPLAQALLESASFTKLSGRFNPLGIMVAGRGKNFSSFDEAFSDYGRFVSEYNRVKRLINARSHNPRDFLLAISQSGYAADPAYFGKVSAIHDRYKLGAYNINQG